jgi:prophage antirepressor-like protein
MSDLNVFAFDSQAVRVVMVDGEPWFVGKDVAEVLGYARPNDALQQHCKGAVKRRPLSTPGGTQEVRIISEPDMLRLIVGSKLPAAEAFERWVFEEVLPSIRKTGAYVDPKAPGAMGVQAQPMPYLSHVADFHVAADRVFRSVLRSARTAGVPLPAAVRRASAVTQERTGLDMIDVLNVHQHLRELDAREATGPTPRHAGAARFWQEWSAGQIEGLPYQSCLAAQAYQAYTHWSARRELFTAAITEAAAQAGHPLRIKVMRVGEGGRYTHATAASARMLLVTEPPMEGQGVWATALAAQFEQHLRAWLGHKRSGVVEKSL